ncbi:MAG: hypothetical protein KTR22_07140, partial [Flavobacteriaceae bacterium]|nr:hypothetical protein [Flavobacteriaceae bacterium]
MMPKTNHILFVKAVFITIVFGHIQKSMAQSFHGLGSSRYGGVQNVVFNPALISAQENKYSFHVLSIYSALGSDYSAIEFGEGVGIRQGFQYNDDRR